MIISDLKEEYIEQIANIEKDCFLQNAWSEDSIRKELVNQNSVFECLVDNGVVIGYYSFYYSGNEAFINNIAVNLSCRRNGFGKILVNRLIDKAKSIGINAITLEVRKSNVIAQHLYESIGFKVEGIRPKFYDNTEDGLIYWYKTGV